MDRPAEVEPVGDMPQIHRVQMRVPPFWPNDPEMWFAQVESQFLVSGITSDDTRYGYVAGNLEARYASEVRDVLTAPPAAGKYEKLKAELIRRLSTNQEEKTKQLLEREDLGDRKPSQFLRRLQQLAGAAVPDNLLRSIWLGRLPMSMQAILATQAKATLEEVAELADAIANATLLHANEVRQAQPSNQIQTLLREVAQLKSQLRRKQQGRSRSQSRNRSTSGAKYGKCWYHVRFGDKARKCQPPCSAVKPADSGNAPSVR